MAATVLSISSQVAFGPVGNSAAVPAMEALGMTVFALPTIVLSHHPGHGKPAGVRIPAADLAAMIDSLHALGVLDGLSAVLTGYFAANDQIHGLARAIGRLKAENPQVIYLCDPVIGGEAKGLYVPLPVAEAVRSVLLPLADIITPNLFEVEWLSSLGVEDAADAEKARHVLGARALVVKSIPREKKRLLTLLCGALGAAAVESSERDNVPNGTGDLFAGLFLGYLLNGQDAPAALARAIASVEDIIDASAGASALNLSPLRKLKP
jgi:pyridoxine kinase